MRPRYNVHHNLKPGLLFFHREKSKQKFFNYFLRKSQTTTSTVISRFRFFPSFLCFDIRSKDFSYQEKNIVMMRKLSTCSIIGTNLFKKIILRKENHCQTVYKKGEKKQILWIFPKDLACTWSDSIFFWNDDKILSFSPHA